MKRALAAVLLCGSLVASPIALAAEPSRGAAPLTVAEAVRAALDAYPLLRAATRERDVAAADLLSAEGAFDPMWRTRATVIPTGPYPSERLETGIEQPTALWGSRLFAGYRVFHGAFAPYDGKLDTADYGEVRAGVQVPLWRDGPIDRRRAGVARAERGLDVANLTVEQQRIEVARVTEQRYWDWVAAGGRLAVAQQVYELARARDGQLGARAAKGDLPEIERIENERALHQRRAALAAAERSFQQTTFELSLLVRAPDGSPARLDASRLPPRMPEPEGTDVTGSDAEAARAVARRPEVRRLDAQKAQARIDRDLADNQRKPAVDVLVAGSRDLGPGDPKLTKPELELSAVLEIPILTRVQDGRVRAAEATMARIDDQARFARDRVVTDVRDAANAVALARARVVATKDEVTVAERLAELERRRFDLGEGTLLVVNLREQAAAEAEVRNVDALADYHRAIAAYRAATATNEGASSVPK